jgi:hypothetical protein
MVSTPGVDREQKTETAVLVVLSNACVVNTRLARARGLFSETKQERKKFEYHQGNYEHDACYRQLG